MIPGTQIVQINADQRPGLPEKSSNSQLSGFQAGSFSAFEHRVATFSLTLLAERKMKEVKPSPCFSLRLRASAVICLRSSAKSASHTILSPRLCASVALPNRI